MLQSIRDRSQGWLTWFLVITICISFALWGIHSYLQTSSSTQAVAKVDGEIITSQQLNASYEQLRQQAQADKQFVLTPSAQTLLKQQALDNLVKSIVLRKAAEKAGYALSSLQLNAMIRQFPIFQVDGQFSVQRFQDVLARIGFTQQSFIDTLKTDELINQIRLGIVSTEFSLPHEVQAVQTLLNQRRNIAYTIIPAEKFKAQVKLDEQQAQTYYQQHQAEFTQAEQVSIAYLELSLAKLMAKQSISELEIVQYYTQNIELFTQPAQYHLAHILVKKADHTPQKLADIQNQLAKNVDFSALAKSFSEDVITANKGGELGWVHSADLSPAIQTVVAKMSKPGSISQPFLTPYGYEIVKLIAIKPAKQLPLEQVKNNVKQRLAQQKAQEQFSQLSDKLANLSFSSPDSLEPAAKEMGLTIEHSGLFSRDNVESLKPSFLQNPKVLAAAFNKDVKAGNNSDLIELSPGQIMVLRLNEAKPAFVLPFAQVKSIITDKLQQQAMLQAAKHSAEKIVDQLNSGSSLNQIASDYAVSWQTAQELSRHSENPQMAIVQASFQMAPPANLQRPTVKNIELSSGDQAVIVLQSVVEHKAAENKLNPSFATAMAMSYADSAYQLYVDYHLKHAKIKKLAVVESSPEEM